VRTPPSTRRPAGTVADWRAFAQRRYRAFRVLAVAQGFIGALSGPAITIPLLLGLGAHPALATLLAVLPILGTMIQRFVPVSLDRTDGNLRGLVILGATIGEPRGLYLAAIVILAQVGALPAWAAIALIGLLVGVLGAFGAVAYGLLQSWYQIILPDEERRLVTPRLGGITLGIGSVVLLPIALTIDRLTAGIGLAAYAVPLAIAGLGGILAAVMLRRLPSPGRVRVPRDASAGFSGPNEHRLRSLARVLNLAGLSAGLAPFLSVYAITILHTGAGFAIAVSATSSATLVASSFWVSGHLRGGSSSRLLRRSMVLRGAALCLGIAAHPANPIAPLLVLVVAVLMAAGDTAGQLSANERLFRLATGPDVIAFQSGNVIRNVAAYALGLVAGAAVMLFGGYPPFALLFGAAGAVRLVAARVTEVTPQVPVTSDPPRPRA
jgi:hypothetical protein